MNGGNFTMKPTPRANAWYRWILTARRALTLLERHPQVDPNRLGIHGTSVGGTLVWPVAGIDKRVKAAVAIYGDGWNYHPFPPVSPEPPLNEETVLNRALIASEAYARRITCPLLFLSASNDGHGKMDLGYYTMAMMPTEIKRQVFTPRYNHHIEPHEAPDLPLWMEWHLKGKGGPWPKTPEEEWVVGPTPGVRVIPADRPKCERGHLLLPE